MPDICVDGSARKRRPERCVIVSAYVAIRGNLGMRGMRATRRRAKRRREHAFHVDRYGVIVPSSTLSNSSEAATNRKREREKKKVREREAFVRPLNGQFYDYSDNGAYSERERKKGERLLRTTWARRDLTSVFAHVFLRSKSHYRMICATTR